MSIHQRNVRRSRPSRCTRAKAPARSHRLRRHRSLHVEALEDRRLLAMFNHTFTDINPDQSDLDASDPDGASGGRVGGLAVVAGDNQSFYAASEFGGVFKSTDGGLEWEHLEGHLPMVAWDVEVDPNDSNRVYATSFYDGRLDSISGIQVSNDAGASWMHPLTAHADPALEGTPLDNTPQATYSANAARRAEPSAFGIGIRPDNTNIVFIGTNAGVARTTNAGLSWQIIDPTPATPSDSNVWDVVVQAGGPNGLGIVDIVGDDGHLRSLDGGNTWTNANSLPAAARGRASIAVSPDESYVLFVAGANGTLYESDDAGATWTSLGRTDPIRGGNRIPFVVTNQKSDSNVDGDPALENVFDLWTGGVSLYRVQCVTPDTPAMGGATRCPAGANPLPAGWFGGFTRGGLGAGTGAHDDVGDVLFDSEVAVDAPPVLYSGDGGIYYASTTSASPTGTGNLVFEQPDVTPHALWIYGMAGFNVAGAANENLYIGMQDAGDFATTDLGNALPAWHQEDCCDIFDYATDGTTVVYQRGFSPPPGRGFNLILANPAQTSTAVVNTYPADGLLSQFKFGESVETFGPDSFVVLMQDCSNPATNGIDDDGDGNIDEADELSNGCPMTNGGDGGVYVTTDITAGPIVWTELGNATEPNSAQLVDVQVSLSGGVPTFYVLVGGGNGRTADQLWSFTGTNPVGAWTRIDTNIPGGGGVNVFAADPVNPMRLYATRVSPAGAFFSNDGGATWNLDGNLLNALTGGGGFPFQNQIGPTEFTGFGGYPQPTLLAFDPEDPNLIVAGGADSGVYLSTDAGASWRLLTDPLGTEGPDVPHLPRPRFAYFDHERAVPEIYIGTQGRGVWRVGVDFTMEPDRFEPNDTIANSTVLGSPPKIIERDLTIHDASDVDFFQYTAQDTGKLIINVLFNGLQGDLDLRVRDRLGNVVAIGTQSNVTPGRDQELLVIPVVTQEEYYIEVFSSVGHTNAYALEIENFEVPTPRTPDLVAASDTGPAADDDVTRDTTPTFRIQADLSDFAAMGITVLNAATAAAGLTAGAAVEVFVTNLTTGITTTGFADPVGASTFLFGFTSTALADAEYFASAAIRIFDGQRNAGGNPDPAEGRSQLSDPLTVTIDTAVAPPSAPDLLASSDSGMFSDDNVTNVQQAAFRGTGEANARVRVFAGVIVVGQGVVNTDGTWEVTVEPLVDGVYIMSSEQEDLAGNISQSSPGLRIEIDTYAPNTAFLDLVEASDSGRHNDDNVTKDNTPDVTITTEDPNAALHTLFTDNLKFRIFDRFEGQQEFLLYNSAVDVAVDNTTAGGDGFTSLLQILETLPAQYFTLSGANVPAVTAAGVLGEGIHNLKLEVEDRAGNISDDFLLDLLIDTAAPPVSILNIDQAATDTGVDGVPLTFNDNITSDTATGFVGRAEADAIVRLYVDPTDDDAINNATEFSLTVALPYDGDEAFANGQWNTAFLRDLNNPNAPDNFPFDGLREVGVTAEDLAGNVSEPAFLDIFIDTQGPRIYDPDGAGGVGGVHSPDDPATARDESAYNLFDPKPRSDGPTPLVGSLMIHVEDLPSRVTDFLYRALEDRGSAGNPADDSGNYLLVGDHNGIIAIQSVTVVNAAATNGNPATATVTLTFFEPLPDDRFTLTVSDNLLDPAGNRLDGESNADEPNGVPLFPSGDGQPGGQFVARFTVDSRAEIGVWAAGSVHVDSNGNFGWDPEGKDGDEVNEDVTYVLGFTSDNIFAGNFAALIDDPNTAEDERVADGFHKLAAYGKLGKNYRWLIDVNNDGVPDLVLPNPVALNGLPAAGNFDGNATNGDEVALKVGSAWYLDKNHSLTVDNTEKLPGNNMTGYPIVGDFDGDGTDDLGARTDDVFSLNLSSLGPIDGFTDVQFKVAMNSAFIGPQERPLAADFDGDGIDDIGLWVPKHSAGTPLNAGEWYILVSDGRRIYDPANPNADRIRINPQDGGNIVDFVPVPFGSDEFAVFGGDAALPVVGNFDPHHIQVPLGGVVYGLTNLDDADDVNGDGLVTANDVLILVNEVNLTGPRGLPLGVLGGPFLDVNRDWDLTAADVLAVINRVNLDAAGAASGEGEAGITYAGLGLPLDPGPLPQGFTSVSSRAGEASSPLAAERVDQYFTPARNATESASVNGGSAGVRVGLAWNDAGGLALDELLSDIVVAVQDADDF